MAPDAASPAEPSPLWHRMGRDRASNSIVDPRFYLTIIKCDIGYTILSDKNT